MPLNLLFVLFRIFVNNWNSLIDSTIVDYFFYFYFFFGIIKNYIIR